MSDFAKNETDNYQAEVRQKLTRLRDSLRGWVRWSAREREFIVSITRELERPQIDISPKQYARVWLLWERSLK